MGRKAFWTITAALALPLAANPAFAQGQGVHCMQGQYSAEQTEELRELGPNLVTGSQIHQEVFDRMGDIAMTAVQSCGRSNRWNEEQSRFATLYELGRINEITYRKSGHLTEDQLQRLDSALATGKHERLWSIIENSVYQGMNEGDGAMGEGDAMVIGAFIVSAGLNTGSESEAVAERIGIILGFMGLQRIGRREFDTLH